MWKTKCKYSHHFTRGFERFKNRGIAPALYPGSQISKATSRAKQLISQKIQENPRSFLPYFILPFNYYSCVCSYLFLHSCCFHARDILCRIHASCMGSPFPTVHTRSSSCTSFFFATSSQRLKTLKPRI